MTHDDVRGLVAEYVLGALDARERQSVDEHLAGCAECRALLAEEARAFDAIGRSVDLVAPPPELRDRVLRAAASSAGAKARRMQPLPWLLAAAAAVIAIVAGWQAWTVRADRQRADAVLAASDMIRFDLQSDRSAARARAFWSRRHGLVFSAEGLPDVPAGRTYQLWVISRGTPISAGVFSTDGGHARIVMPTPETLTQVDAVAISVEPDGGSDAPSSAPILVGTPGA